MITKQNTYLQVLKRRDSFFSGIDLYGHEGNQETTGKEHYFTNNKTNSFVFTFVHANEHNKNIYL